jgi:hypothetical protein
VKILVVLIVKKLELENVTALKVLWKLVKMVVNSRLWKVENVEIEHLLVVIIQNGVDGHHVV